jgi:hypothetical protein
MEPLPILPNPDVDRSKPRFYEKSDGSVIRIDPDGTVTQVTPPTRVP